MKFLNLRNKEIAEELALTPAAVSDILHGRVKKISGPVIELLRIKFNVNPDWLERGEGEMFLPTQKPASPPAAPTVQMVNDNEAPYEVINGSVEEYPQVDTVEKISRTKWFKSLSSKQKWMVAAIADDYIDDEILRDLQLYADSRLRFKRTISEDLAKTTDMKQKGEAG